MTTPSLPRDPSPEKLSGLLVNRYRIEREIGEGGMATVYLAHDLTRDVRVAVKAPKPELVMQLGPDRFAREIQISTKLQHPHIVPVLDSGMVNGVPFYVMPFIDGETLEARLTRTGPLPVDDAIAIACEVLDGLIYAHKLGFVHRDVKPSNVLLSNGHALLADFGIARAVERTDNRKLTESGFALGTAEYMSPEQAAGDTQLDGRSDIYSLACVLYEMLAGAPPFTAATARAVMARHFVDPVPSIRTVRDTVPVKLEAAIITALAKTPVDRFADADVFRRALKDPTLREITAATRGVDSTAARRRTRVIATAAVLLVVGAAALWSFGMAEKAPLDPNRVMVFPFVAEGTTGSRSVGEDVATIIGNALDVADPLRWIDGWSLMDASERANIAGFSLDAARNLARARRCATFVTGRLSPARGDSVVVSLTLYDVASAEELSSKSATGPAADPWRQGLRAVSEILPELIPGTRKDMSAEWKNREPGAVANFLLGEAAFRRVRMSDALGHFRKAINLDSTFAMAALRGAQAASWNHRSSEAQSMIGVALAQPLPPRYHQFALGFSSYLAGRADTAVAHLRAAIAADPDMTVAWMQLGEAYTHLLPTAGNTDSMADLAFMKARQLDTSATSVLLHPIALRLRRGDTLGAAPLLARFRAAQPDSELVAPLLIADECVRRGAEGVNWRGHAVRQPLFLLLAARSLAGGGAQLGCAQRAFGAILTVDTAANDAADARRFTALLGLQASYLAQNRPDQAAAAIDSFATRWGSGASLFLLGGAFFPELLPRARAIATADSAQYGASYLTLPYSRRLWELGVLGARTGNATVAANVAAELRRRAVASDSAYVRDRAASLEAFVQLARGDSAVAEQSLTALLANGPRSEIDEWDEAAPLSGERLTLARLLNARRAFQEAIEVASVIDSPWPLIHLQYLPASLELRAQAAKSLGNSVLQSHYLARLAALRSTAKTSGT